MDSASLYSQAIVNTAVGFCIVDTRGKILQANDAFVNICHDPKREKSFLDAVLTTQNIPLKEWISDAFDNKTHFIEVEFIDAKKPFFAIANASVVQHKNKEMLAIFFTQANKQKNQAHELQEQVRIEIEKNRKKEAMMQSQSRLATMGEMIANIAHQWRQPLNILALVLQDTYIKFQFKALDHDVMEKNYEKANNLIQYMSQTIDDFRSFFKDSEDDLSAFELQKSLSEVLGLVGSRFESDRIECRIQTQQEFWVFGHQNGFKQVMINLLNNAQEAIRGAEVSKGIIDIAITQEKEFIQISVSDNGKGVPKSIINQIFEPYFTTKHKTQGTGLGLYMSKQIIEKNSHGKLEVRNTKEGAKFTVSLPKAPQRGTKSEN